MSSISVGTYDYGKPRTIWSLGLQLFYNILAMLPVYYYMREIIELPPEARYILQFLPLGIAFLLFFIQLQLNQYFWHQEKILINRDPFQTSLKSVILTLSIFYILFFLFFGYWFSNENVYSNISLTNPIGILMASVFISILVILFIVIMMLNIQDSRLKGRSIRDRFRR